MEHIRRCFLVISMAILAACGTIQAPDINKERIYIDNPVFNHETVLVKTEKTLIENNFSSEIKTVTDMSGKLALVIAKKFNCSLEHASQSIKYARQYEYSDFPRKEDILAIIAVESSFNPMASSGGSRGVMQVLIKTHRSKIHLPFDINEQIRVGSYILHESYVLANKLPKAGVMAYNVGIGAYRKGARPEQYYRKYETNVLWIKDQERRLGLV